MIWTILQSIALGLCLLYIGYSWSAQKGITDVPLRLIAIGRTGVVVAIAIFQAIELGGHDTLATKVFNIVLIPMLVVSAIGIGKTYRRGNV